MKQPQQQHHQNTNHLLFDKKNYRLMYIGIGLIFLGFLLMALEKQEFGFGVLGLWIGPIITLSGFILEIFAIMKKPIGSDNLK